MPRVQQTSMSLELIVLTISSTLSKSLLSRTSRHAAPKHIRDAPAAFALVEAVSTSSILISLFTFISGWERAACGQYAQSSLQPPVLIDNNELICTSPALWYWRCTVAASYTN